MKLKLKYIAILSATFSLALSGCEDLKFGNAFLEKPISTDMYIDSIYAHKVYAEQALAEIYHTLPDYLPSDGRLSWCILELLTDLGDGTKAGAVAGYYDGQMTPSFKSADAFPYRLDSYGSESAGGNGFYGGPLYGIRKAWIFIENIDRVPDMTDREKAIRKAEAKMVIAYHYSQMLRYYGGMPWIDRAYKPEDEMKFVRLTVEETVNKIDGLLDEVIPVLPWSVEAGDDGRLTAASALAIKTRMLLFAASPLFNSDKPFVEGEASTQHLVWYGNYDKARWERALKAGIQFLDENKKNGDYYQLVDNGKEPRDSYASGYFDRFNKETLISSRRFNTYNTGSKSLAQIKYGNGGTTGGYADMFEMKDGTEFSWDNPVHAANPFFLNGKPVRDPRMYETLFVNEDRFQGRTCEIWDGGRESCEGKNGTFQKNSYNGYGMRKFQRDLKTEVANKFYSCPLIRLPEVYLSIAEAMNELGIATQKDKYGRDAYDYVNLVRSRVEMPGLNRDKHTPGEKLREAILHERAVEFGYEEVRFFDINRWKRSDLLKKPVYRLHIAKKDNKMVYTPKTDMINKRVWIERWNDRYFLIPFRQEEINKKYGLIQNPGW